MRMYDLVPLVFASVVVIMAMVWDRLKSGK